MEFARLWPQADRIEIEAHVHGLRLQERAPASRPLVVVNFISSVDGRAAVRGRSGALGDDGDRAIFRALRRSVDAVLVGTGTLAGEHYGRMVADEAARAARVARGLRAEPICVTVTRGGRLPLGIPLFQEPEARVIVYSGVPVTPPELPAQVEVEVLEPLSFAEVLTRLRAEHGVRALLCEGGPAVFGALLQEDTVDELFLSLSPRLVGGGSAPAITRGLELPELAALRLVTVLERAGMLFLHYAITR